jgi:hypothetical protein
MTGYIFQSATVVLAANQTAVNFQPSAPTISGFSLSSGPSQMGFQIQGSGFGSTGAYTAVTFNGNTVTPVVWGPGTTGVQDGTRITIQVPATVPVPPPGQAQPYPIVVAVGNAYSNPVNFQVTPAFGCAF